MAEGYPEEAGDKDAQRGAGPGGEGDQDMGAHGDGGGLVVDVVRVKLGRAFMAQRPGPADGDGRAEQGEDEVEEGGQQGGEKGDEQPDMRLRIFEHRVQVDDGVT